MNQSRRTILWVSTGKNICAITVEAVEGPYWVSGFRIW